MTSNAEPYAIEHASFRARLLCTTAGLPWDQMDDARQDLLLDYLRRLPKFDRGRGDRDGFVRGVMRNHAIVLATRRHRIARREVLANDLARKEVPIETDPLAILDGLQRYEIEPRLQMNMDIERVLRGLPTPLQQLARQLKELTVLEICAKTGKSRSRVYRMIWQLRDAFMQAGFRPRYPHWATRMDTRPGFGHER